MKYVAASLVFVLISSCNFGTTEYQAFIEGNDSSIVDLQEHPGKKLMENNCYACHNPKTAEENMIAPPMVAIKMHYITENTSKEEFKAAMLEWAKKPTEAKSKMPGAITKFGLMPYQYYAPETIEQIADYMFENEIDEPDWFDAHYKQMQGNRPRIKGKMGQGMGKNQAVNPQSTIEERGIQIAQTTKAELGKNLMGQIQKNGVIAALDFCNIKALSITDSMSTVHNARIKRVTDKPRNPINKASAAELQYLESFKKQVAAGGEVNPIIVDMGNEIEFYYPIVTNTLCLKCHGTPGKDLETLTLSKIQKLYPMDKAIGYSENEVRGMWSIGFEK